MDLKTVKSIVEGVPDPEIPVLSLGDLGVIRDIYEKGKNFEIHVSPTYSGCPATRVIHESISVALLRADIKNFIIKKVLSPAWSTTWISEVGKTKLEKYGIAPPNSGAKGPKSCPQCKSINVTEISNFGPTPCQALWRCNDCLETFNYFKCL